MEEITNELYLSCVRTATEIVAELTLEQVNASINHFDEDTKRSILSQKLAKEMFDTACEEKPAKEEG
jgi:hypothetical protein